MQKLKGTPDIKVASDMLVGYNQQVLNLPLAVVYGSGLSLLGHNWFRHIILNWSSLLPSSGLGPRHAFEVNSDHHPDLFYEGLGKLI